MQHAHRSQTRRAEARAAAVPTATSSEVALLFGALLALLSILLLDL